MTWVFPGTLWLLAFAGVAAAAATLSGRRVRQGLRSIGQDSPEWQVRSFLKNIAIAGFMALAVLAAAEPRAGRRPVSGERSGLDVAVAFDISRSMLTRDTTPSRLGRGVAALGQITRSIADSRFSLTPFKGGAISLVPMTEDRVVLDAWIENLGVGMATAGGTDIESALRAAAESFPGSVGRSKILLIITDGESLTGRVDRMVRELADLNIPVHVLLAGTEEGGPIPLSGGDYVKDSSGRPVVSRADGSVLEQLAGETGGSYHELSRPGSTAELIGVVRANRDFVENRGIRFSGIYRYRVFLIPALLLLLFSLAARIIPWRFR